jgi:PAS domain S-box-containing protein
MKHTPIRTDKTGHAEVPARYSSPVIDALDAHIAILDESGVILAVNRSWREYAGDNVVNWRSVSEGVNYPDVCAAASGPDAEHALAFAEGLRSVMKNERNHFSLEYPGHSPQDQWWFVGRIACFEESGKMRFVVVHENITGRKQAEEALRQSEERYQNIYKHTSLGFVLWGIDSRILGWNKRAEEMFGWSRDEALGRNVFDLIVPPEGIHRVKGIIDDVVHGKIETRLIIENVRKNGEPIWCEWNNSLLHDRGGNIAGAMSIALDVTGQKRAEETE